MKRTVIAASLALALAAGLSFPAVAEDAKPVAAPARAAAPAPAAELAQLKYMAGSWSCSGKAEETPMGPAHATAGKASIRLDVGGFWYAVRYEETKTKENPTPVRVGGFWGYDAFQKKFVAGSVDSTGGFANQASPGWEEDRLVFVGDMMGMGPNKVPARDTFTKKGANELTHVFELSMVEGHWTKVVEETCKRAGAAPAAKSADAAPAKP
ncbi:MAG: DUF1579 family protein [Thermoanaerobaculia bacterium]